MAKRRLNKKVALIGSVVFVFVVLAAIAAILYLNRDPDKFIKDGDAAIKAAREAVDDEKKAEEYERAIGNYSQARNLAKTDSQRVKVLFKLADVFIETDQWRNVLGCWTPIIRIEPKNVKARFGRLKYLYIMADSGVRGAWQEVASQASELMEVAEEKNLLAEDTGQWDPFGIQEREAGRDRMGPYLYLVRGRANLEIARMGASTDPDELLALAVDDLRKVQELEPNNVSACGPLAVAVITQGEILASRGDLEERDRAAERAKELLERAAEVASTNPSAHVNLLSVKLMLARRSDAEVIVEQIKSLEPEYLSVVGKFPSSAQVFSALADFYQLNLENLDKAVEAGEKAVELDGENVAYVMNAASLHYSKFCIDGQMSEFYKAIEVAKKALTLPGAQDKPGPREWANRMSRVSLYAFLTECYIEQVLEPREVVAEEKKQEWLREAEQAVNEIVQLLGLGESPQVIKLQGMLDLAKGDRNSAVRKMYTAYEQFKSVGKKDSLISYHLAKVFENTAEIGAVKEFLESALRRPRGIDERKPEALLDYADVLLRRRDYGGALSVVNFFEDKYWANERSKRTRMAVYIGAGQFDEVEEELAKRASDDPNRIKLHMVLLHTKIGQVQRAVARKQMKESTPTVLPELETPEEEIVEPEASVQLMTAELKGYWGDLAELVEKLLAIEPNSVGAASVIAVCNNFMEEGKTDEAKVLINKFLECFPDNITALFYKQVLSEPEPGEILPERRREIEEKVLSGIADPIRRAMSLGRFYHRYNELDKAAVEFRKVFKTEALQKEIEKPAFGQTEEGSQRLAASYLFEIALARKDWELAEQIGEVARQKDMDDCGGSFFAARLAVAKAEAADNQQLRTDNYKLALTKLNECLKQRPIFSRGLLLRSKVNAVLGDEHSSVEDAQKAASLNPLDGSIARGLAFVLYRRNQKLGDNVSSDQVIETRNALHNAISLNPRELQLQSLYAEYISSTEPSSALAIRQHLQKVAPTVGNALLLGKMALRMALDEANAEAKKAYIDIAASSFEDARAMAPQNKTVLEAQAEYYRVTGQAEKAEELLAQSQDQKLLWSHYFRLGRFEDAKRVLEQLYEGDAKDSSVVRGLLLVAEKNGDREAVKRYSEELLSLEDTVDNELLQIQTFLRTGLVKEAEFELQSFKEKYPDEPRALLLEAWLAMRQGQLKRALELTNRNLETDQNNALAWRIRGEINLLMANYNQAINDLKTSKSLSAEPVTRVALAKAYVQADRVEDAITELKSMIDYRQTSMEGTPAGQGPRELLEQIYLQSGRKEELRRFYAETIKKFPGDVLWYKRAGAFAAAEGEFETAERLYGLAWEKSRKDSRADAAALDGYLRALVLGAGTPNAANGAWNPAKLDKVFEEGRKYVDSDFAPVAYLWMAEAKMKLGDKATAIRYCRKSLAKAFAGTNETFAAEILRRIYSLLGADEVLSYCRQRLEAEPDSLGANLAMFNLMKITNEYNKAIDYIDKCLEIAGSASPRRLRYVVNKVKVLELAYKKTSDNDYLRRCIAEYESLLAKMPNNTVVLNNLAYLLAKNNERLAEALEYAKRAHEARPNNPGFLDTYAYVLYKNGRNSEADVFLQAALQQYEQNKISVPVEVYENLGLIKEELGAKAEALAAYERALEIGADTLSQPSKERIKAAVERLSRQEEIKS